MGHDPKQKVRAKAALSCVVLAALRQPGPASILAAVKDGVVEIARLVGLAVMKDGNRLRREQVEHAPRLLGTEQSADPIEKHELGPGEKNAREGEQLLLTRGEARARSCARSSSPSGGSNASKPSNRRTSTIRSSLEGSVSPSSKIWRRLPGGV